MRRVDKDYVYSKLQEIKESKGVNVSRYIREVASSDGIPYDVVVFINKHYPIEQLYTYNMIYEKRRKNPLYKSIVDENASLDDKLIALNSFITQSLIRAKQLRTEGKEEDSEFYFDLMNSSKICEALKSYFDTKDETRVNEVFMSIREVFKKLFNE